MRTTELIQKSRKAQGITNVQIAEAVGLTEYRVRKIGSAMRKYDALSDDVSRIGDYLGIDRDILDEARLLDALDSIRLKRSRWMNSLDKRESAILMQLEAVTKKVEKK